jgi:hypothetical protein
MSLDEMRQVAANACAVGASKYLGKDSLRVIARDLAKGTYAASRGPLPPPARGGAGFTKKAKAKAKANAAREHSSPDSRARVSPSPRKKPILTPKRKRLEKAPTRADARETTPSGDANVAPRSREDAAFDDAPNGRDTHDPYDFRNEDNAATRAFAALGAAAAAMEAEDEYYNGGGGGDDDDDPTVTDDASDRARGRMRCDCARDARWEARRRRERRRGARRRRGRCSWDGRAGRRWRASTRRRFAGG